MARIEFKKARKTQLKLRMAIDGPSGSGKTYTALRFAFALAGAPDKVAVIDTENRSASKYIGESPDGFPWQFDVVELDSFHPLNYVEAIVAAEKAGYEVLVIDSLSHAWDGVDGILELHDREARRSSSKNSYAVWREVTPFHNRLIQAILRSKLHIIATMRSKMEYAQVQKDGKTIVEKLGMQPVQRAGMEYEFDIVCDLDWTHNLLVSKSRCSAVDGALVPKPGPGFLAPIQAWLSTGEEAQPEAGLGPAAWKADEEAHAAIRQRIRELGLAKDEVLLALGGVARLTDWPGDVDSLLVALAEYAAARHSAADEDRQAA